MQKLLSDVTVFKVLKGTDIIPKYICVLEVKYTPMVITYQHFQDHLVLTMTKWIPIQATEPHVLSSSS